MDNQLKVQTASLADRSLSEPRNHERLDKAIRDFDEVVYRTRRLLDAVRNDDHPEPEAALENWEAPSLQSVLQDGPDRIGKIQEELFQILEALDFTLFRR